MTSYSLCGHPHRHTYMHICTHTWPFACHCGQSPSQMRALPSSKASKHLATAFSPKHMAGSPLEAFLDLSLLTLVVPPLNHGTRLVGFQGRL